MAITPAQRQTVASAPCIGITVEQSFGANTPNCWNGHGIGSAPTAIPGWTYTGGVAGSYAPGLDGILVAFPLNTPRITSLGYWSEEARTNVVLWDRDLTNSAWVKVNTTAAKDQIGADGVVNSASSVTATGANATILQITTIGLSARFQTAYVKRITGTGTVSMTLDAVTYTAITVTSAWTQVSIPTQTVANPTVGFKLAASGDVIAVDFVQDEAGVFATTPIATTTAAVTRAIDFGYVDGLNIVSPWSLIDRATFESTDTASNQKHLGDLAVGSSATERAYLFRGLSNNAVIQVARGGSNQINVSAAFTGAGTLAMGVSYDGTTYKAAISGLATASAAGSAMNGTVSRLSAGANSAGGNSLNGSVVRLIVKPTAATNANLQAQTQ